MRPSFLDNLSWAMAEVYGAVTDRILVNLAHYFPYIHDSNEVSGSFEYQARMLAQMGQVNRETVDIIMKSLDGADAALRNVLETAIMDALKGEEPKLRQAAQKGLLNGSASTLPLVSPNQMKAFTTYYRQSADKLNLVNTVMLESTQAAYAATVSDVVQKIQRTQSILNIGAGEVVTGVSTWNQAMHSAVGKMMENGLTGFIDHAGRRWSPEAYVAMDVRTTMFNTSRAAIWERADDYGSDLYQVSSHNGARPLCYPWQGKVISRSDIVREVEDLDGNKVHVYAQSETSYGQAAGIFGVNCRHYPMTFIPGFSTLKGEPQDPEENAQAYEESQHQRELERKLRAERRDLAALKAQGANPDEIRAQQERVKRASQDIDDFCEETGRTRRKNREYTPVKAEFPDKDSYDPKLFPTEERDKMREFFGGKKADVSETVNTVDTNIEKLRSAAEGATDKFEFWGNMTEEQQAALKASGLSIDEAFEMVKGTAEVSEWKAPNPGGTEMFALNHDFSTYDTVFEKRVPTSETLYTKAANDSWMAEAGAPGLILVREDGLGDAWKDIMAHEFGHQLTAYDKELANTVLYNPGNILGRWNNRVMAFDGVYYEYSPEEAWATSVKNYILYPQKMMKLYPETYEAVDTYFKNSPTARNFIERGLEKYRREFVK